MKQNEEKKYEYLIKHIDDDSTGVIDDEVLQNLINKYARLGWQLKTIYTNEIGKNSSGNSVSSGIIGFGSNVNATIERTYIVFEKEVDCSDVEYIENDSDLPSL